MTSPLREAPWYCTWRGERHPRDEGLPWDDRYALGRCEGNRRPLVRDEAAARLAAREGGKYRPKGPPVGVAQGRLRLAPADGRARP